VLGATPRTRIPLSLTIFDALGNVRLVILLHSLRRSFIFSESIIAPLLAKRTVRCKLMDRPSKRQEKKNSRPIRGFQGNLDE
jgi:hypothetical protein